MLSKNKICILLRDFNKPETGFRLLLFDKSADLKVIKLICEGAVMGARWVL